jgi:hypothetical protein
MRPSALMLVLLAPFGVRADGCKYTPTGRKVPERDLAAAGVCALLRWWVAYA